MPFELSQDLLFLLLLHFVFVGFVACVAEGGQNHECHEEDAHDGASSEHPSKTFDFRFAVAVEEDGDFVVEFLDLWEVSNGR